MGNAYHPSLRPSQLSSPPGHKLSTCCVARTRMLKEALSATLSAVQSAAADRCTNGGVLRSVRVGLGARTGPRHWPSHVTRESGAWSAASNPARRAGALVYVARRVPCCTQRVMLLPVACPVPCRLLLAVAPERRKGCHLRGCGKLRQGYPRGSPTAARVQQPGRLGSVPLRAYGGWRRPIGSRGQHAAPAITKARVPLTCQLCGVHGRRSVPTRAPQRCRVKLEHALAPLVAGLRSNALVKHNRVEPVIAVGVTGMTCFVARQARARARQRH